jgi:hypothetical protein
LAHFRHHSLAQDVSLYSRLRDRIEGEPFAGIYWPLTLELAHLSEADAAWASSPSPAVLRTLHDSQISIIDWDALPKAFVAPIKLGDDDDDFEPEYALEDIGSDYTDDDDLDDEDEFGADV